MEPKQHSFGGSALDRYVFDFDTDDGTPADAAVGADDAAAADTATVGADPDPDTDTTAVAAPPADPGFDPAEIEARFAAYEAQNQQLAGMLAQIANAGGGNIQSEQPVQPQLVDEFGQLDPNALLAMLEQRDQRQLQVMQQVFAPFAQTLAERQQAETLQEGAERLNDILADDIARNGEFAADPDADKQARQLVQTLADQAFPQVAARYGGVWNQQQGRFDFPSTFASAKAVEQAMSQASGQVRGLLKAAGTAAVTEHVNHNATLAGQRREPGTAAAGLVTTDSEILPPGELAKRYAAGATRIRTT